MSVSKNKLRKEKRNKAQERKFYTVTFIVTLVVLAILFLIYEMSF